MTQPWAARPATWDRPGQKKLSLDDEAILDQIVFLSQPPIAVLRQTGAQSLSTGAGTAITFDAEDIDTHGGHSTVTNTSRYTAQIAGWYQLSGGVSITGSATNRRACWWTKNGSDIAGSEATVSAGDDTGTLTVPARTILVLLAVADYVELKGFQDSGGSLNTVVTSAAQPSMHVRLVYLT